MSQDDSNNKHTTSILKNLKKLDLPRLQINEKLRVRQYIISDPSTIYYTEYYSSIKENSSADWQQQVKHIPTNLHNLDLQSNRQHSNTTTICTLPLIDSYNPYYPDPDFGFDPYWDIQIYNQHHLHFYKNFTKNTDDIEPDQHQIDQVLNAKLSIASVDPWQNVQINPIQQPRRISQKNSHTMDLWSH